MKHVAAQAGLSSSSFSRSWKLWPQGSIDRIGNGRRRLGFALSVFFSGLALLAVVGAAPAAAGTCPNEQIRQESDVNPFTVLPFSSQLAGYPECRSYEMVSPPFKSGNRIETFSAISPGGSRVIVEAIGAFAGTGSDLLGAKYELDRSESGWTATTLNPPAAEFTADTRWFEASVDLGETLWGLRRPSQPESARDLYLRREDGSFVEIGPTEPPSLSEGPPAESSQGFSTTYGYAGASDDLSHVFFNTQKSQSWPGDETRPEGESLYEYVGVGNTRPVLVGVSDGSNIVGGERRPQGELISRCSTFIGSRFKEDTYNAVSASGEKVFFTAAGQVPAEAFEEHCAPSEGNPEFDELYARVRNLETVPISEPMPAQCGECQTARRANATFQGASEDGSKVFFLTEQELLPGSEGKNLYEYDFDNRAGKKTIRVSTGSTHPEVLGVSRLSEDGSHVYFVARAALTIGPNKEGHEPLAGSPNLYVFERDASFPAGRLTFVGTLSEEDERDWEESDIRLAQATPDGRFFVFRSSADLTAGDTSVVPQVFEYDAQAEELVRVSVGQAGYVDGEASADAHGSSIVAQNFSTTGFKPARNQARLALSSDGSTVLFHNTGALTPYATGAAEAGAQSVYEYRSSGPISDGETFLVSDGANKVTLEGSPESLTPDGENAFFLTIDPLVGQDTDLQFDLYDARADGGFQAPRAHADCEAVPVGCQGPVPVPAPPPPPATAAGGGASIPPVSPRKPKHHKPKRHRHKPRRRRPKHLHRTAERSSNRNRGGAK